MEKTAVVLFWSQEAEEKILFTPAIHWVKMAVDAIPAVFLLGDTLLEDDKRSTATAIMEQINHLGIEDILLLGADAPLIEWEEIIAAYKGYQFAERNGVAFESRGVSTGAGWYKKETVLGILGKKLPKLEDARPLADGTYEVSSASILPANSSVNRHKLNGVAQKRMIQEHLANGVEILLEDGVMIAPSVTIGDGTLILPGTILRGETVIGTDCVIGPNSVLENAVVGNGTSLNATQIEDSSVGIGAKIGPMVHVRPNSQIGDGVKIGNFVEIKNSTIGQKTSVSHLTYVGDSDVGDACNFGCGVVTVNYDGKNKHRTTIGDHVFIGCNCNLVAPVTLGDGVYAAAGTTITDDVPPDSLVIGRAKQTVKEGWAKESPLFNK